jgi:hypothetical protein
MSDQYGLPAQYPQQTLQPQTLQPRPYANASPPEMTRKPLRQSTGTGFGPAALVVILFATIPRNQFFSEANSPSWMTVTEGANSSIVPADSVVLVPVVE